ncbi:hypothetical protein MWH25_06855 [Natroniella acetigena]|uniref:hypothetical protein n=1 Tax=Natroniella acetigena TaxID=52004 RepID=UPI00200B124D|nr:hypothetical protein [Natroniella acetigena]MCK8827461.1 hypothetical protein [Natroniella acetigena]
MKQLFIVILTLIIVVNFQFSALASNSFSVEFMELDTSYQRFSTEIGLTNKLSLAGDYAYSRINPYNLSLKLDRANLILKREVITTDILSSQLGIGYNYNSTELSTDYFPQLDLTTTETGPILAAAGEIELDEEISLFGQLNYVPYSSLRGELIAEGETTNTNQKIRKYSGRIGGRFKLAENLSGQIGYNFINYLNSPDDLEEIEEVDGELQEQLGNNSGGIFIGVKANF